MNSGKVVFSQIIDILHPQEFKRCELRYPMRRISKSFSAWDQFLCMAFAQITFRESLRDIVACLKGRSSLYTMGIRGNVTRTNIAYANENRDWRVFADLAHLLIRRARPYYEDEPSGDLDLDEIVYALDSTVIDLCLSLFPWANFRSTKAAVKVHTLIDLRGSIPVFISITDGSVHDVNILDELPFEPGSIYVMDRAYVDFARLFVMSTFGAFFVLRAKSNFRFRVVESKSVDKSTGLRCDQTIRLITKKGKKAYPHYLRRIAFTDPETGKRLVFITNRFDLPALTIAVIYKNRWRVELFFKWIKQNLRIKSFFGTSENAVKIQIWIAICVYLVVAIIRKKLVISASLQRILQVFSLNVFQKDSLYQILTEYSQENSGCEGSNQLMLNGF